MICLKLSSLTLIVALSFGLVQAQQSNSAGDNAQTTDAALRDKAVDLLKSLASQISILQSAENRARLGSNIVESLWNDLKTWCCPGFEIPMQVRLSTKPHQRLFRADFV